MSFGFEIYGDDTAEQLMGVALDQGVRNFFASVLANNQPGVARKLATMEREHGVTREEIFLCGSVTQCRTGMDDRACYEYTANMAAANLHDLGVDYLDQIMLDYPPSPSCDANTCASPLRLSQSFPQDKSDKCSCCAGRHAHQGAMEGFHRHA